MDLKKHVAAELKKIAASKKDLSAGQEKRIAAIKSKGKPGAYKAELGKVQGKEEAKGAKVDSAKVASLVDGFQTILQSKN